MSKIKKEYFLEPINKDTEYFINKLKETQNHIYNNYNIVGKYIGNKKKILIKDKYGELLVCPLGLLKGKIPSIESAIDKHSYFLNKLKEKNLYAYENMTFISEYKKSTSKIIAYYKYGIISICPSSLLCGKSPDIKSALDKDSYFKNMLKEKNKKAYNELVFLTKIKNITEEVYAIDKYGILKIKPNRLLCGRTWDIRSSLYPNDYFIEKLKDCNADIFKNEIVTEYSGRFEKIIVKTKYGEVEMTADSLLSGHNPDINSAIDKHLYFIELIKDVNESFLCENEIIDSYKGMKKRLKIKSKYGVVKMTPTAILRKTKPSVTSAVDMVSYTKKQFIETHGYLYDYSKFESYNNAFFPIPIICKTHGVFYQATSNHKSGEGCPRCKKSIGENKIIDFLKISNISFVQQKTFDGCRRQKVLPFDFYIEGLNILIEYDGEQHYMPVCFGGIEISEAKKRFATTIKNDRIKTRYCEENGFDLVRIPYYDFNRMEEILNEKIINVHNENIRR